MVTKNGLRNKLTTMAKLFNKIRRQLVSEQSSARRTSNYLKYAIGEILLVVIGILIAVAINNWRELQKENVLELTILGQINDRLVTDSLTIQEMVGFLLDLHNVAVDLKTYMKEAKPYTDTLSASFSRISYFPVYRPDQTPYDRLRDAGIDIVKNDSLRNLIPTYFMDIARIANVYENYPLSEYFRNIIYPKYFKSFSWNPKEGCEPKDYKALKKADDFFVALDYVINDTRFYRGTYLRGAKQNAYLLDVLRKELKKREK